MLCFSLFNILADVFALFLSFIGRLISDMIFLLRQARNCNLLDPTGTGVVVALLSISTGVFFVYTLMAYRRPLRETFLPTTNPVVPATGAPRLFLEVKDGKGPEDD